MGEVFDEELENAVATVARSAYPDAYESDDDDAIGEEESGESLKAIDFDAQFEID
ncbi:hypothetical protein VTK56DRAFT_5978 [Thermocarpiscus australiensis]